MYLPTVFLRQEAILDIKQIRVNYLRTWFIPDVIAAFPIGYILLFAVKMETSKQKKHFNFMNRAITSFDMFFRRKNVTDT